MNVLLAVDLGRSRLTVDTVSQADGTVSRVVPGGANAATVDAGATPHQDSWRPLANNDARPLRVEAA